MNRVHLICVLCTCLLCDESSTHRCQFSAGAPNMSAFLYLESCFGITCHKGNQLPKFEKCRCISSNHQWIWLAVGPLRFLTICSFCSVHLFSHLHGIWFYVSTLINLCMHGKNCFTPWGQHFLWSSGEMILENSFLDYYYGESFLGTHYVIHIVYFF
jgi:hypothetical protein